MKKFWACLGLLSLCACGNNRYAYDDAYWGADEGGIDEGYYNRNRYQNDNYYEHHDGNRNGEYHGGNREGGGNRGGGGHAGGGGHGGGHR
jgi:hypothetical protein